jgi:hypothetical protein
VYADFYQDVIVNQPTKAIRLGGCAAPTLVATALFVAGCGGPEGAGTVNMTEAKEAAARRGIPDGSKRAPVADKSPKARRANTSVTPVKPQRQGH